MGVARGTFQELAGKRAASGGKGRIASGNLPEAITGDTRVRVDGNPNSNQVAAPVSPGVVDVR